MTEIMSKWVKEKIWGGTYMSILDDLKKIFNYRFSFRYFIRLTRIHPFSHILILSDNLFLRSKIFPFSRTSILPLSLFLLISFTLFPIIPSSHSPIISEAWSATYYVDATNGRDTNNGTSELTPWKTIAKVNASNFNPGAQISFKRWEIWRGQLIVPSTG
jgi:hypothetical protein